MKQGSLAHEWARAQEAQEAFMAERAGQYRTILEHHSGEGDMHSSLDVEELMVCFLPPCLSHEVSLTSQMDLLQVNVSLHRWVRFGSAIYHWKLFR